MAVVAPREWVAVGKGTAVGAGEQVSDCIVSMKQVCQSRERQPPQE
jgi:hypothetical protein